MSHKKQLIDFANAILEDFPDGGDIDMLDLQDIAEKYGILVPHTPLKPCGESCQCAEVYSDEEFAEGLVKCYRKADWLLKEGE